uniref:FAS1 domain-containing protein n=1 Tax=Tetraselmis sp. GSL018 TaxID=582737 RepID=A0A061RQQ3_9CHLO|mmetsp:Transcript_8863/g.21402  ORF Transcript_8863/g.21402 Transcript_8863/m.21402 type:complete len:265 (+) Transcript_8863:94-888(+)|eukprot:CAMPEP_0177615924 /NCGR_PEP_ID=MMETSP0419_2-20121207/23800_1 /TAXON_ID=582737 /ORGANISM="Tetraselmis sp., Strain GSL018" /LENGTH=264 /DNA_ID=CAMNT_0019113785 /DNA_START=48 /DNA_END=842 /DNA_ORIENTATION=-
MALLGRLSFIICLGLLCSQALSQQQTLLQTIEEQVPVLAPVLERFSNLDLVATLNSTEGDSFTIFLPLRAALLDNPQVQEAVGTYVADPESFAQENLAGVLDLLQYHIVQGEVMSANLTDGQQIPTLSGANLTVSKEGDVISIVGGRSDGTVSTADTMAANGIVHVIDSVLLPPVMPPPTENLMVPSTPTASPESSSTPSETPTDSPGNTTTPTETPTASPGNTTPTETPTPGDAGTTEADDSAAARSLLIFLAPLSAAAALLA